MPAEDGEIQPAGSEAGDLSRTHHVRTRMPAKVEKTLPFVTVSVFAENSCAVSAIRPQISDAEFLRFANQGGDDLKLGGSAPRADP